MTTRTLVTVLASLAISSALSGCGDPGPASRSIALTNMPDGPVLVIIPCDKKDEAISEVRVMNGADPWASADWVVNVGEERQRFELELDSISGLLTRGSTSALEDLSAPLAVQTYMAGDDGGVVGVVGFSDMPDPGKFEIADSDQIIGHTISVTRSEFERAAAAECSEQMSR
ncbi:MAG: hypothetical protein WBF71_04575 [Microthrixaceae bacterium]